MELSLDIKLIISIITFSFQILMFVIIVTNLIYQRVKRLQFNNYKLSKIEKQNVSILIPVRNEEENIENLMNSLKIQNAKEIIICNDNSTDNTYNLLQQNIKKINSETNKVQPDIRIINGKPLPEGWSGKNWACWQLANEAKSDYILFIDADVSFNTDYIINSLNFLKRNNLKLLSIFPKQISQNTLIKSLTQTAEYLIFTTLPTPLLSLTKSKYFTAAIGQFMLFEKRAYFKIGGHENIKSNPLDDITLTINLRKSNLKTDILLGEENIQAEMYKTSIDSINGLARSLFLTIKPLKYIAIAPLIAISIILTPFILLPILFNEFIIFAIIINLLNYLFLEIFYFKLTKSTLFSLFRGVFFTIIAFRSYLYLLQNNLTWRGRKL